MRPDVPLSTEGEHVLLRFAVDLELRVVVDEAMDGTPRAERHPVQGGMATDVRVVDDDVRADWHELVVEVQLGAHVRLRVIGIEQHYCTATSALLSGSPLGLWVNRGRVDRVSRAFALTKFFGGCAER
jgi:hypothetical protein